MPELIRLQTPNFEFSVWASDIGQQAKMYNTTMASRAGLMVNVNSNICSAVDNSITADSNNSQPSYSLRFAPATELEILNIFTYGSDAQSNYQHGCVFDKNSSIEYTGNTISNPLNSTTGIEKYTELTLSSPLFFENTQYQFEWVFCEDVTSAHLIHRSQSVNEAFRFTPERQTSRGIAPARLTGTINTGNDVGWLRLPLMFEREDKSYTQHIAFEVLPTKMVLHEDLPAMYQAIDQIYPLWRFSLVEKTEQDAATSRKRGYFPLMWLANFSLLRTRFEQGLKVISIAPHSRLQPTVAYIKAPKLKGRLPPKLSQQIKQDFANGQYDKRYRVEKKKLSVDTPENRFIKMAVNKSKQQIARFEAKLRQSNQAPENQRLSDSFLNELHSWQQPLQQILNQSFLKDVGAYTTLCSESLVLQQKTGYSAVYRIWQELKFYLDVFGNQSSISMKSVAEIYEIWCFLCLKQILEQELDFKLVENSAAELKQNDFFEYRFEKNGIRGAFHFKRADGVRARLAHEPVFGKTSNIRSYLVTQKPDIVLEITLPKSMSKDEEKQFIWLFDAKYRIKTDKNRFDDSDDNIESIDYVPDDAINQMHRYRDALILLSESPSTSISGQTTKKSRPVFGAFALYPGFFDQTARQNPYATAISEVGIGAFALLPSQTEHDCSGHLWLLEFLRAQIGTATTAQTTKLGNKVLNSVGSIVEKLYVQEAARIPYYGMHQVLYPDLTLTATLDEKYIQDANYFKGFKQGTAQWYRLSQSVFLQKFKQHVAEEIRYLALASTSVHNGSTLQIDKLWPVKNISVLPYFSLIEEQGDNKPDSTAMYYLFELGKPLTLQTPVTNVPHEPMTKSMKLTTLTHLERVTRFIEIEEVYTEVMR